MSDDRGMKPVNLNKALFETRVKQVDPAFRQITDGLVKELDRIMRDPNLAGISCCVQGCCVSWCCVQIS